MRLSVLSCCVWFTSARSTRFPCNGVSPNGHRWVYALAEHTATVTVHAWWATREWIGTNKSAANFSIRELAGSPHGMLPCYHSHEAIAPPGTNFTFAFATNPFRRVLTNAAHNGFISGTRFGFKNQTADEAVAAFRTFVRTRLAIKHNHMIPHAIWVQASMLSHFPQAPKAIQWVGRTSTLDESMRELLLLLGYPPGIFSGFESSHCGATCASMVKSFKSRRLEQGVATDIEAETAESPLPFLRRLLANEKMTSDGTNTVSRLPWYDGPTAARVVQLFEIDFATYNFSRDPARMWD